MVDMIKDMNKLSKFVREKRGDMSLRDFAHLCGDISHTQIDSIERGVDPRTGIKKWPRFPRAERKKEINEMPQPQ